MTLPIVIVGAGMGGLSAAAELARRGERVLLLEPRPEIGGKARAVDVGGAAIDVGPTVLTMRWVFDEIFEANGRSLDAAVSLRPLERTARHAFADGSALDLYPDVHRNVEAIARFAGTREANGYTRFAAYSEAIAKTVEEPFLRSPRPTFASLLRDAGRLGMGALRRIDAHRSMWKAIGSFFEDARLRALFARYATYVGSSPLEAAATFNLIAHVERAGVVAIDGGISRLAAALASLASSLGVEIMTNTKVERVTGREVALIRADGSRERVAARAVIMNADIATIGAGLFGDEAAQAVGGPVQGRRSLSAMTWAIAGTSTGFELGEHNVFFGADYERETRELWNQRVFPSDPTVYVCAQNGGFFIIANAPANPVRLSDEELNGCEQRVFSRLTKCGVTLSPTATARMTPLDFETLAPGTSGAIYGEPAHGPFAALARHGSRTKMRGLYVAGGSVHPGPGVPMAALSGRLAAEAVLQDLASMPRSRQTAIAGSISMP